MTHAANNPFFGKFKTPFETPPFDKIKIEIGRASCRERV